MLHTLFRRNLALMVGVVLAGQALAGLLVTTLVIRPQVIRIAEVTADMLSAVDDAMMGMAPARRAALVAQINAGGRMELRPQSHPPSDGLRAPTMIERQYLIALASRLRHDEILIWRTDGPGRLWFLLQLGGDPYWISISAPRERGAVASLVVASIIAFIVSVAGGLGLQYTIDRPLRRLAAELDDYHADGTAAPLAIEGPAEIAAVAQALNRMTGRLAEAEAERAVMLAGVSHDLRTPLTRLRLCLEMLAGQDPDLEATASRQVDRIEDMLGQFLSFARGFADEPCQPTDVVALARAAIADAGADTGLDSVSLDAPETLVHPLRAQATRRAIANLVGNALRHGKAPVGVRITHDGSALRVSVHDAGQGFDPAAAQTMLRPFARGDSARSGDGTGLGLAITQRAALAQGGRVEFHRDPGEFSAVLILPDQA
ncbi:ATP-binding protein [Novosphingobium nitrogenifigens]|nr:ATP-binding protein [Novosphingobium nitrogenifigens]